MPPRVPTHNNPYSHLQGGWDDGNHRQGPPCSLPGVQGLAHTPPQSVYGALPVAPMPGVPITPISPANTRIFRFVPATPVATNPPLINLTIVGAWDPARTVYRVVTASPGAPTFVKDFEDKLVAVIEWHSSHTVIDIRGGGGRRRMDQWLTPNR